MIICTRKATVEDAAYVALLGRITFTETFGHLFDKQKELEAYLASTFGIGKIRSSLQKDNNAYWLAFADELPVGYAKLKKHSLLESLDNQTASQLQKIYVLKDFLNKKIGIALYQSLIKEVQGLQSGYLWLVVLQANQRAIAFYQKNGFYSYTKHFHTIGSQTFGFDLLIKSIHN